MTRIKVIIAILLFVLGVGPVQILMAAEENAQKIKDLEARVNSMENYIRKLDPILESINYQMQKLSSQNVVLDVDSRKFYKIETNTGNFLIAVKSLNRSKAGYILTLNIGNPNSAAYGDVKIIIRWGKQWDPKESLTFNYENWRNSLYVAEYSFEEKLEPGNWTEIAVELVPAEEGDAEYLECGLEVGSVMLQKQRQLKY